MTERKKGAARDNFISLRECKELGPYPSWDNWKIILFSSLGKLPIGLEEHLHEWYVLRRKIQLGSFSQEEANIQCRKFSEEHSSLFDDELAVKAFKTITERTAIKQS